MTPKALLQHCRFIASQVAVGGGELWQVQWALMRFDFSLNRHRRVWAECKAAFAGAKQ